MRFVAILDGNDKGKTFDVKILSKKINGVWVEFPAFPTCKGFVCYSDIEILEMSETEKSMPVSFD